MLLVLVVCVVGLLFRVAVLGVLLPLQEPALLQEVELRGEVALGWQDAIWY